MTLIAKHTNWFWNCFSAVWFVKIMISFIHSMDPQVNSFVQSLVLQESMYVWFRCLEFRVCLIFFLLSFVFWSISQPKSSLPDCLISAFPISEILGLCFSSLFFYDTLSRIIFGLLNIIYKHHWIMRHTFGRFAASWEVLMTRTVWYENGEWIQIDKSVYSMICSLLL